MKLKSVLWIAVMLVLIYTAALAQSPQSFSIVVLPDTQYYSLSYPATFTAQTQWIFQNKASRNIAFVIHEGDIVDGDTPAEWSNASRAMAVLEGANIPFIVPPGNHDQCYVGCTSDQKARYHATFPVSRFSSPTFCGTFEAGKSDNMCQLFSAGGLNFVVIGLQWGPTDANLIWASQVADLYPDRQVVIVTHFYLYNAPQRGGEFPGGCLQGNNEGIDVWNKLVKTHRNIRFVVSGHVVQGCPGETDPRLRSGGQWGGATKVDKNNFGDNVYQLFANYQEMGGGGNGFLRIMTFNPSARTVQVQTYSPTLNLYATDIQNNFTFNNVDLAAPKSITLRPPVAVAGYDRTVLLGEPVNFDGSNSADPDGRAMSYSWNFGNGSSAAIGATASHAYTTAGNYTATLTVSDGIFNSQSSANITVLGGNIQLVEDFRDGLWPSSKWTVVEEGSNGKYAKWLIHPGTKFVAEVNFPWDGTLGQFTTNKLGTYILAGNAAWTDYRISAKMWSQTYNIMGFVFRYQDANNHYRFEWADNDGFYRIVKVSGGIRTELKRVSMAYTPQRWYTTEVLANKGTFTVSTDGVPYLTVTDPNPILAGKFGLLEWANSTYFTDVVVTGLGSTPSVGITINPTSANLSASQTKQFGATVTGTSNTAVTWTVTGLGTISPAGLYTAPSSISSQQPATVTVTSVADPTKSASANITLQPPPVIPISVAISPTTATLSASQRLQFGATVTGNNNAVSWAVSSGSGSIDKTGLYTAPASISATQPVTVTATSVADPTKSASASITLQPAPSDGEDAR